MPYFIYKGYFLSIKTEKWYFLSMENDKNGTIFIWLHNKFGQIKVFFIKKL